MRGMGRGGCVLYYAEHSDIFKTQSCIPTKLSTLEAIWVEIKFHSQNLALSIMYRPSKDTNFFSELEKQLDCVCNKKKNIIIMGDLNSNLLNNIRQEEVVSGNDSVQGRKL